MDNPSTNVGEVYWVSAGAEYNNENEVWVGQASFVAFPNDTVSLGDFRLFRILRERFHLNISRIKTSLNNVRIDVFTIWRVYRRYFLHNDYL